MGEVYKYKAQLNMHGGKQEHGVNYWETFSPMVTWYAIRLVLVLAIMRRWYTRQNDFVLAFPQAPIECDMYMELPKGFVVKDCDGASCVLLLKKNLYGQKQAGRVWNKHLHSGLLKCGFKQLEVDECVYYEKGVVMLI